MKKTFFVFLLSGLMLSLAISAFAATTLSFSPASVNVKENQNFSLTVKVDAQGVKNYTVKLELDYPEDLLKVESFNFSSSWMPINQSGYDLIDNTNGLFIKTAGYPGGLDSIANFGTISFSTKKAGNGVIKVTSNTMTLNAQNENLLSGNPQVSIVIEEVAQTETTPTPKVTGEVKETPAEQPKETISQEEEEEEEEVEEITTTEEEEGATVPMDIAEEPEKTSLLAALITLGTGSKVVGVIVFAILILVILFIIRKIYIKKKTI